MYCTVHGAAYPDSVPSFQASLVGRCKVKRVTPVMPQMGPADCCNSQVLPQL